MDILSRDDKIIVKVNGRVVAEHSGDPKRSKIDDQFFIMMFRNIRYRRLGCR